MRTRTRLKISLTTGQCTASGKLVRLGDGDTKGELASRRARMGHCGTTERQRVGGIARPSFQSCTGGCQSDQSVSNDPHESESESDPPLSDVDPCSESGGSGPCTPSLSIPSSRHESASNESCFARTAGSWRRSSSGRKPSSSAPRLISPLSSRRATMSSCKSISLRAISTPASEAPCARTAFSQAMRMSRSFPFREAQSSKLSCGGVAVSQSGQFVPTSRHGLAPAAFAARTVRVAIFQTPRTQTQISCLLHRSSGPAIAGDRPGENHRTTRRPFVQIFQSPLERQPCDLSLALVSSHIDLDLQDAHLVVAAVVLDDCDLRIPRLHWLRVVPGDSLGPAIITIVVDAEFFPLGVLLLDEGGEVGDVVVLGDFQLQVTPRAAARDWWCINSCGCGRAPLRTTCWNHPRGMPQGELGGLPVGLQRTFGSSEMTVEAWISELAVACSLSAT